MNQNFCTLVEMGFAFRITCKIGMFFSQTAIPIDAKTPTANARNADDMFSYPSCLYPL